MKNKNVLIFALAVMFSASFSYAQTVQDILISRVVKYTAINTQSDYDGKTSPTTEGQKNFAKMLSMELKEIGLSNVRVDENSYVYAEVPGNVKYAPVIFLSAHMDTTPDEDLKGRNPIPVIHNYIGGTLKINNQLFLTTDKELYLASAAGGKIITSDGETLIGGDDKAGITIAVTAAQELLKNKKLKHGTVKLIFTTDEEIGNGTKYLTKETISADYGIVLDGRGYGRLVTENFNAADFTINIKAPPAGHPGSQTMPSAAYMKDDILQLFPKDLRPYTTAGTQGYASYYKIEESGTECKIHGRIREHDINAFEALKAMVTNITSYYSNYLNAKYKDNAHEMRITLKIADAYKNSKEILKQYPQNFDILMQAYNKAGVKPKLEAARGGSDANEITYMGIPSYNLFAGYHNDHSPKEWISSIHMEGSLKVVLNYIQGWAEQAAKDKSAKEIKYLKEELKKLNKDSLSFYNPL